MKDFSLVVYLGTAAVIISMIMLPSPATILSSYLCIGSSRAFYKMDRNQKVDPIEIYLWPYFAWRYLQGFKKIRSESRDKE